MPLSSCRPCLGTNNLGNEYSRTDNDERTLASLESRHGVGRNHCPVRRHKSWPSYDQASLWPDRSGDTRGSSLVVSREALIGEITRWRGWANTEASGRPPWFDGGLLLLARHCTPARLEGSPPQPSFDAQGIANVSKNASRESAGNAAATVGREKRTQPCPVAAGIEDDGGGSPRPRAPG